MRIPHTFDSDFSAGSLSAGRYAPCRRVGVSDVAGCERSVPTEHGHLCRRSRYETPLGGVIVDWGGLPRAVDRQ